MSDKEDFMYSKCDKYDLLIAVSCGAMAGLVDIFLVGDPTNSKLLKYADKGADELVKKFAKLAGWKPHAGNSDNTAAAIKWLEDHFGVNYDHQTSKRVGGQVGLNADNHHFKSLGHSPDIIGCFFSILDQFTGKASFIDNGKIVRIETPSVMTVQIAGHGIEITSLGMLYGKDFMGKIIAGFCNWIGHLFSDVAGSYKTRHENTGRGDGIPIPFMNLFGLCDFGSFNVDGKDNTLAELMCKVFESGYDARFGATLAVPVLLEEISIKLIWTIQSRFYYKRDWIDCIPNDTHGDLRCMLIVGNGTLCIFDVTHAAVTSGGNWISFFLKLNIVAWFKLLKLVIKEVLIRLNATQYEIDKALDYINAALDEYLEELKTIDIVAFENEAAMLADINSILIDTEDKDRFIDNLYETLSIYNSGLPFKNHDEFDSFMKDSSSELIL